jgi:hypothetical protein
MGVLKVYALHLSRDLAYIVDVAPINSTVCNTFHHIPRIYDADFKFNAYIEGIASSLFPSIITEDGLPSHCFGHNATSYPDCPSAGLLAILRSPLLSPESSGIYSNSPLQTNITMFTGNNRMARYLTGNGTPNSDGHGVFVASSIPDFISSALVWYWQYLNKLWIVQESSQQNYISRVSRAMIKPALGESSSEQNLYKPFVQVECSATTFRSTDISFPHGAFFLPPWTEEPFRAAKWPVPHSIISRIAINDYIGKLNFTWVDLGISGHMKPSLLGLFAMNYFDSANNSQTLFPCTIDARWVPVNVWIDPTVDPLVYETLPNPAALPLAAYSQLYISLDWAHSLNVQPTDSADNHTAIEALGTACSHLAVSGDINSDTTVECLEAALALYLTDGLSRFQRMRHQYFLDSYYFDNNLTGSDTKIIDAATTDAIYDTYDPLAVTLTPGDLRNPSKYTQIHFSVYQYGYGYPFRGITIYIAVAILLLHVLIALIHMSIVVYGGWSSDAWAKMDELVLLALHSTPGRLRNTYAGVSKASTWGKRIKVRETIDDHLELVLDGEPMSKERDNGVQPRPGKKYGSPAKVGEDACSAPNS